MTAAKYAPGDKVAMINDYGAIFPHKTILRLDDKAHGEEPRYFIDPTDTPWFSFPEKNLVKEVA